MTNKANDASNGAPDPAGASRHRASGKPRRRARIIIAASTATIALGAVAATANAGVFAGGGTPVGGVAQHIGYAPKAPKGAVVTGTTTASTELHLSVNLAPRDPQALKDFISAVSTKGSAQYHHYLTKGQFASAFGPTQATIDQVTAALRSAGLTPGQVSRDHLSIPVSATADQASHAFSTGFTNLKLTDGRTAYVNNSAPSLPPAVAADVTGVVGLSNLSKVTSHHQSVHGSATGTGTSVRVSSRALQSHATSPTMCAPMKNALGGTDGVNWFSPGKLAGAYGMSTSPTAGSGVTVAVFELESVDVNAVNDYQTCFGTHVPFSLVKVDGGPTAAPSFAGNIGVESALDIEDIMGLAPGASIIDYAGPDASKATDQNVLDTFQQIIADDKAQVISSSWGACEPLSDPQTIAAEGNVFAEAAAQGQTVVAASGDSGSTDCFPNNGSTALAVDDPAGQPYVTGVGGTTMNSTGSGTTQSTWNSNGAGGGGVSIQPAQDFQAGFQTSGQREVPDVSALADPQTGYPLMARNASNQTIAFIEGGTSGAAPTWAAEIAQADASAACKATGQIGYANPSLYSAAQANYSASFQDITTGNNDLASTGYTGGLYAAKTGYDDATGLGTPQAAGLTAALCHAGPAPATGASTFHSMAPQRLLDTRYGTGWGGSSSNVPAGGVAPVKIEGNAGIPKSGVTAVVLNVSVLHQAASGWLTAYPAGAPRPNTSNLNWGGWGARANLVTVPVGGNGWVDLYNGSTGSTAMFADIFGYYTADTSGSKFDTVTPSRLLDTRGGKAIPGGGSVSFQVTGKGGLPGVGNVTSVVLNVTTLHQQTYGWLAAYGDTFNGTSNINWSGWGAIPNLVTVPVDSKGMVTLKNGSTGSIDAFADVFGYYTAGSGYTYTPLPSTQRLLDTRYNVGHSGALAANGSVNLGGIPGGAKAVVLNVTELHANQYGWLTAWPAGTTETNTSNLNWSGWGTNPNAVIVPTGPSGSVSLGNSPQGSIDLFADLFGYFS